MKIIYIILFSLTVFNACKVNKPNSKGVTDINKTKSAKSNNGIYAPDSMELNAIRIQHPEATLSILNEGYILYSFGPCTNCHQAKNIYQFNESQWIKIIDEMSLIAKISPSQKDALSKYIFSIKATQAK
jgi:hypothetical protein